MARMGKVQIANYVADMLKQGFDYDVCMQESVIGKATDRAKRACEHFFDLCENGADVDKAYKEVFLSNEWEKQKHYLLQPDPNGCVLKQPLD